VILADTNTWVSHLRAADHRLTQLLEQNRIVTCDVVVGELLLGAGLPPALTHDLKLLPGLPCPTATETRAFIERHHRTFRASGVGWAEAQIVLTAMNAGALIYSSDKSVRSVWKKLGFRLA
jgi:predicted nucleic acid-binding protein